MRAITIRDFDSPPAEQDLEQPTAGEGELLIAVQASSANPVDNAIAAGMLRGMFDHEFPVTLGRDFAGTVEATGAGVEGYAEGDGVFGFLVHADPAVHAGAWSELTVARADGFVAHKPENVASREAGAAPLAAVTALAAIKAVELGTGDTVLIVGASGGVGSFAAQLARRAGARVIAPGLSEDHGYLESLGVDEVVAREGDVASAVSAVAPDGVDVLIDVVSMSPEELESYVPALAQGGRVASPVGAAGDGEGRHNVMGSSDPAAMETLAELLANGELEVPIQREYPLDRAPEALADLAARHTRGKLAIKVA
jgi:NADPH:quinone reductase